MEPEAFYDDLAPDYHLIFEDMERSIARQVAHVARARRPRAACLSARRWPTCARSTWAASTPWSAWTTPCRNLLTDEDLAAACASLHRSLVPGGLLLASTRDYDASPTGDPPRRFADRTIEQIWEWEDDERYVLRHRIVRDGEVAERRTRYRALRRATLTAALRAAGFVDVEWPPTGFPEPVVSARTSSRATATWRTRR